MIFDAQLAEMLSPPEALWEICDALADNTRHEAERIPGLKQLQGSVSYSHQRTVVGRSGEVIAALQASLRAEVEMNRSYGDIFYQTHAPESMLPLALMGARSWRNSPKLTSHGQLEPGALSVILHPRVLEEIIRHAGLQPLSEGSQLAEEGSRIASPEVTLVDDPGLDGLATSRGFDDEGLPVHRSPLIIRGRMTQLLRSRSEAKRSGLPRIGGRWQRPGCLGPGLGFSSLMMERGELGFHEMLTPMERGVLVQALSNLELGEEPGSFSALIRWGLFLRRGFSNCLMEPMTWVLKGQLFGEGGLLSEAKLSRELFDTGTGIMPYCLGCLSLQKR